MKLVSLKQRNPFNMKRLESEYLPLTLLDLEKASQQQLPSFAQEIVRKLKLQQILDYLEYVLKTVT